MRGREALLLGVLLGALGCSSGESGPYFGTTDRTSDDPATFYVNNYDEPEDLDPGLSIDRGATALLNELFEGLVVLHPEDLHPTPGVATRYEQSDDNRLFRFHLRSDARWSDGQPVTAGDFVYAWARVLRPATGARMATMLYRLKNGALFHQGKLRVLGRTEPLRRAPRPDGGSSSSLPANTPVRALRVSPAKVRGGIAPLATIPGDVTELTYRPGGKKSPAKERLVVGPGGRELGPAADGAWRGKSARIEARGPAVTCNGKKDHWYRLASGDRRGFLPGCMLRDDWAKAEWVMVEQFDDLPTFRPRPPKKAEPPAAEPKQEGDPPPSKPEGAPAAPVEAPRPERANGWVRADALRLDPSVLGVRAVGDHTLEVELAEPTPYFLELCSYVTFFPVRRDLIERMAAEGRPDRWYRPEHIIVNGPYTLDSWTFRYEIRMKQNPHYHGRDKLKIHRIVWLEVSDQHANMNLYRTGELDYVGANVSLPGAYMKSLSRHQDFHRAPYLSTYWYELNTKRPPLDDVRVRQALNLATNKQLLVDAITRSGQQPASHYVPDFTGSGYAVESQADGPMGRRLFAAPGRDFDPARGRALLGEAGYQVVGDEGDYRANGFPAMEILYNTSEGHKKIAVAIQDMWKRHLGITAALRNEEWKVMLKNIQTGNFQVGRSGWAADYNHPHTWMETFLSYSAQNWTGWKSPAFDRLVEQGAATADPTASIRMYREAEKLVLDAVPRLPLYFFTKSTMVKPYVKGFYDNPMNQHILRFMWIDPDWRSSKDNEPAFVIDEFPQPGRIAP